MATKLVFLRVMSALKKEKLHPMKELIERTLYCRRDDNIARFEEETCER